MDEDEVMLSEAWDVSLGAEATIILQVVTQHTPAAGRKGSARRGAERRCTSGGEGAMSRGEYVGGWERQ